MKRLLSALSLLVLCAGAPATFAQPGAAAVPQVRYDKTTLPNGLEVILVEDHRLPIVAVNIWYHVGPANEAPGLTGPSDAQFTVGTAGNAGPFVGTGYPAPTLSALARRVATS